MMILGVSNKSIIRNSIAALIVLLLWFGWLAKTPAGDWVVGKMLPGNMDMINQTKHLDYAKRWEMKLGAAYVYLDYVKQSTPDDAVILYPDASAFFPAGVESPFKGTEPFNKVWATRFLHPRKLVLRSEMGISPYSSKITHVAIVNGVGYDVFTPEQMSDSTAREAFTVIPISK